ncbi:MAG: cation:proton antiporter [Hyphomicrobium sp.]
MAATLDVNTYKDAMVVLGTAAVVVPLMQRLRISPIVSYLMAGVFFGPHFLTHFTFLFPPAGWIAVSDPANLEPLGELGVSFLLFIIGLGLTPQRLWTMRRLVFGLGILQIIFSAAILGMIAALLGQSPKAALIVGSSLALSSTAIVIELLSQQNRMSLGTGRASFAILLMQDLAVIPLLLLIPSLSPENGNSIFAILAWIFVEAFVAISIIVATGYILLRPLFRLVASNESGNVFVAAVLLVALGSGIVTAAAGLSMALGAFIAGLLLAETEYRKAIETTIEPVKDLLLGCFFFTVGAQLNLQLVLENFVLIAMGLVGLLVIKGIIVYSLVRLFGFNPIVAGRTASLIGPSGEFALIVFTLAMKSQILSSSMTSYLNTITLLSMGLIPILDLFSQKLFPLSKVLPVDPALEATPSETLHATAIVIGHGRVGALVSSMFDVHGIHHIITEKRPNLVSEARSEGRPVFYGDALNINFLQKCGLSNAKAVVITIQDWDATEEIVRSIRGINQNITIIARARDAGHASYLYEIGVSDAVPETIEASLQLCEAALVDLGVPTGPVIASIHSKRDDFRSTLQKAAGLAGRKESHGLRSKTTPLVKT